MISWWLNPHCIPCSWWRFAASACWSRSFSSAWGANRTPTEETSKTSFRRKPSRTRAFLYVFNCFNGCLTKKKWCFSTKTAISNQELGLFRSGLDRMECRNPGDWWLMTPTGVSSIFWTWHMWILTKMAYLRPKESQRFEMILAEFGFPTSIV